MASRRVLAAAALAAAALVALAAPAGAQATGSPAAPPAAAVRPAASETDAPPLVVESGRAVTPVPAVTSALALEALLTAAPAARAAPTHAAFDYALGAPGRSGGLSFDGLDPARAALGLDGRSFDDLITGAPRFDLLPFAALDPLRLSDGRFGHVVSAEATTRTFRLGRPVTELRYLAGQSGVQVVSGTHAQTRLPPALLRGGSRNARLTLAGHVMSRNGRGTLVGATLRHTDVLARALLTRPGAGLTLDAGVLYTDRTDGARRGVVAGSAASLFDLAATVREPTATRRTVRTEGWATAQRRFIYAQPLSVTLSGLSERLVYRSDAADTLRVHARRVAFRLTQPLGRSLLVRLDALADAYPRLTAGPLGSPGARLRFHASVRDSIAFGASRVTLEGGAHLVGQTPSASLSGRAERGRTFLGARYGGTVPGQVEASGLAGVVGEAAEGQAEHVATVEAGAAVGTRHVRLGFRAFGTSRWNARLLVARGSAFAYETAPSSLGAAGATVTGSVREATTRGLYGHLAGTAHVALRPSASDLHRREADALPRLRADVRLGARATGVGGVLDLDLAVVGRAWTAFRSRVVEPRTGLLALPDPTTEFGAVLPARGTLGAEATAVFSRRATLFLQIDHALGEIVGAAVVQGEPLPIRVVRFGVFWALLD